MQQNTDGLQYSAPVCAEANTHTLLLVRSSQRTRHHSGHAWPILAFQTFLSYWLLLRWVFFWCGVLSLLLLFVCMFFCRGIYGERYRPVDFFLRKQKIEWLWHLKINLGSAAEYILENNSNQRQDVMNGDWLRPSHSRHSTAFDWLKCTQE